MWLIEHNAEFLIVIWTAMGIQDFVILFLDVTVYGMIFKKLNFLFQEDQTPMDIQNYVIIEYMFIDLYIGLLVEGKQCPQDMIDHIYVQIGDAETQIT